MSKQPPLDIRLSPNYSQGRQGTPVRRITFHHVVGSAESAIARFSNPSQQVSSHFVVASNKIYCCVDTDNTAWTNGNWASNLESVTIEHAGDWRFGFRDEGVIQQSATLVAWLRTLYPNATPMRHRDVSQTACPGDLPVEEIWNRATQILNPPKPQPPVVLPAPKLTVVDVKNKIVVTNKDAQLWDLSFTSYANAKSIKTLPKGTEVEISATAKHPLGSTYYLTEYSFSKGIMNGINVVDVSDKVTPVPPTIPPVTPPVDPPKPPTPTKDQEQDERLSKLEQGLKALGDLVNKISEWLRSFGK